MNADELKKDVIAAMNAAVCGALDTGSLIDIEKTAQSIADKYAQLSAQSVSAVQPAIMLDIAKTPYTHAIRKWENLGDLPDGVHYLYTHPADADAVDAKEKK